jgi:hypothetical protein
MPAFAPRGELQGFVLVLTTSETVFRAIHAQTKDEGAWPRVPWRTVLAFYYSRTSFKMSFKSQAWRKSRPLDLSANSDIH